MSREFIGTQVPAEAAPAQTPPSPPMQPKATLLDQFAMAVSQEQVNQVLSCLGDTHKEKIAGLKQPNIDTQPMEFASWQITLHTRVRYAIAARMLEVGGLYKVV